MKRGAWGWVAWVVSMLAGWANGIDHGLRSDWLTAVSAACIAAMLVLWCWPEKKNTARGEGGA